MLRIPHVHDDDPIPVDDLGFPDDPITNVKAPHGFSDEPHVPKALREADELGLERPIDVDRASYFLSQMTIVATNDRSMARWRKKLFIGMSRNAANAADYFRLPTDRVVTAGSQ